MPFTEKYKPKNLKEFVGHKEVVDVFLKWISKWKPGCKALLFYGMPGTGKTALIHAYSNEMKFDFIEMNASDFRSAQQIQGVFGQSMKQASLFKKSKVFLIDEVDGIAGREDLGGVGAIIKIIKESRFPIVLTANNAFDPRLRTLRQYCQLVQFKKISVFDIEKRLREICEREKIKAGGEVLKTLAKRSGGDLRSAINDLETVSQGRKEIAVEDLAILGQREREANVFEVLRDIFKAETAQAARLALTHLDKDPDEVFWWIENNISKEYEKPEEVAAAYEALSIADIFKQRIMKRQNWRMRAYMIDMMTCGVSMAKQEVYKKFTRYQYPGNIIMLGRSKEGRRVVREILKKLSVSNHCSMKKFRSETLPFVKIMMKDTKFKKSISEVYDISKDNMKILKE